MGGEDRAAGRVQNRSSNDRRIVNAKKAAQLNWKVDIG